MFAAVFSHVPDLQGRSILDFGCGLGRLTDYLPPGIGAYVGLDKDEDNIRRALNIRPGYAFRVGNMEDITRSDVVFCIETIQCFNGPVELAKLIRKLCTSARYLTVISSLDGMETTPKEVEALCELYASRVYLHKSKIPAHPGNFVLCAYR